MRLLIIGLVFVAGCGSFNPMANHYISKIKEQGDKCISYEYENQIINRCYTLEERLQLYEDQRIWTRAEKALLAAAWGCQVADIIYTRKIIDDGGSEQNPLYGSDPSIGLLSVAKGLMTTVIVVVADTSPYERKQLLAGYDAMSCGIAAWNAHVYYDD